MQQSIKLDCIILAGGIGSRLAHILKDKPKCLAEIKNKCFLEILLTSMHLKGNFRFILALGKGHMQVIEEIKKPWTKPLDISYVVESKQLGTGGAIKNALNYANSKECLVLNGDTLISGNLNLMQNRLDYSNSELVRIALTKVKDRSRYGGISVDENFTVKSFLEKGEKSSGLINTGLYRIKKDLFMNLKSESFSFEDFLSNQVINKNLKGVILKGPFIDIGIPQDLNFLRNNLNKYV